MNALQQDIINIIRRNYSITTADICDKLEPLGYGGNMSFDDFKRHIGKTISKMRAEGHVTGEDRPNPGTKPIRYWMLPEAEEMASDVVEVETHPDSRTYSEHYLESPPKPDYDPRTVAFPKRPMSANRAISEFRIAGFSRDDMAVFMAGIAAAERHHGITE